MHTIEPFYNWRHLYKAENDRLSPFYQKVYNELAYEHKIYNYYIHPQWDFFGSNTLYIKVLYVDYNNGFAIMEFIGEWNDCIADDIMLLKRNIIDNLLTKNIVKYILIGENVLNFHANEDCYYEEWLEEVQEVGGWVVALNFLTHVLDEIIAYTLHYYIVVEDRLNDLPWRTYKPKALFKFIENILHSKNKYLV